MGRAGRVREREGEVGVEVEVEWTGESWRGRRIFTCKQATGAGGSNAAAAARRRGGSRATGGARAAGVVRAGCGRQGQGRAIGGAVACWLQQERSSCVVAQNAETAAGRRREEGAAETTGRGGRVLAGEGEGGGGREGRGEDKLGRRGWVGLCVFCGVNLRAGLDCVAPGVGSADQDSGARAGKQDGRQGRRDG